MDKKLILVFGLFLLIFPFVSASFGYDKTPSIIYAGGKNITNYNNYTYNYHNATGNATQFITLGDTLTLKESWLTSFFNSIFSTKTTDDLIQGSTNFYDNRSFNQTLTDSLYTGGAGDNSSWNQSLANSLYAGIQWSYNETIPANEYTNLVNQSQSSWIEATFLRIVDFFTKKASGIYLYNDTNTIYFNESQLNKTISSEGIRLGFNSTSNATYDAKAGAGNCSAGQLVMNTTTSGVQCITPTLSESDPIFIARTNLQNSSSETCPLGNYSYGRYQNGSFYCRSDIFGVILESDPIFSANFTNMKTDCPTGNYTYGVFGNGTFKCRSDVSGGTETDPVWTANYSVMSTTFNVNRSNYWDNLNSINTTQMENNGGVLNILVSWLTSLFYIKSEVDNNLSLRLLATDQRYNETSLINSLNSSKAGTGNCPAGQLVMNTTTSGVQCIVPPAGSESDPIFLAENASLWAEAKNKYNVTYHGLINNASYLSTYNVTYHGLIQWGYNQSSPYEKWFYNQTEGVNINSTQMSYSNGFLNILEDWLTNLFNALFGTKTTDDLTQGSTNFYDNRSWNQTLANTLYGNGGNASWNQSLANTLYAGIQWSYNQSVPVFNYITANENSWLSTYNVTYATWLPNYTLYSPQWYNHTSAANLTIWNTYNSVWLSTYNVTYHGLINNASYLSTYNATYDAKISFPGWTNVAWQNQTNIFTKNQNMSKNNITDMDCIIFKSGGKICSA